jgi:hypothetical protein
MPCLFIRLSPSDWSLYHVAPDAKITAGSCTNRTLRVPRCAPRGPPSPARRRLTMPRPIQATIHTEALRHNLARDSHRRARCQGVGRGQGQCLRPRHRPRVRRPARRRRLCAAGPAGSRTGAQPGLARPRPAAGGGVRAARPGAVLAAGVVACRALRGADRLAGRPQDARAAPRVPQAECGHEPPGLHAAPATAPPGCG